MIRVAVVEDEEMYAHQIVEYLKRYEEEKKEELQITVYRDGDGITAEYRAQFDIIFMDIQMKFVDGMTAAEEIRKKDSEVIIIFITNMTQYAIRGYEVDALDYVLKPVHYFAFAQKLGRAIERMKKRHARHIIVPVKGGIRRLESSDIYYIESQGHNLIFHMKDEEVVSGGTMKSMEEELKKLNFSRGNKCYLINLEHVEGIKDKCAIVKGEALLLSRSGLKSFMQDLTKYWGEVK